ncbi:hypothetical protein S83_045296 [Arachis hypogaea]
MGTVDQLPRNKGHNAEVVHLVQILFGRYRIVAVDTALGFTLVITVYSEVSLVESNLGTLLIGKKKKRKELGTQHFPYISLLSIYQGSSLISLMFFFFFDFYYIFFLSMNNVPVQLIEESGRYRIQAYDCFASSSLL